MNKRKLFGIVAVCLLSSAALLTACDGGGDTNGGPSQGQQPPVEESQTDVRETEPEDPVEEETEPSEDEETEPTTIEETEAPEHIHTPVIDARVEPTCAETGLTEGSHCDVCGEVLADQEAIPATDEHTFGTDGVCTECTAIRSTEGLVYEWRNASDINGNVLYNGYGLVGIGTADATEIVVANVYRGEPVVVIDSGALADCTSVTSITIPDSVTYINGRAFAGCTKLESITLGEGVTSLGSETFKGCVSLTNITIPDSVTTIGDEVLAGCDTLASLSIGKGMTEIATSVWEDMPDTLTTITVSEENPTYFAVGNCVVETETKTLIFGCQNSVIPADAGITSIGNSAFYYCGNLSEIVIPEGVTQIGEAAFYCCSALESITLPESLVEIGPAAFSDCRGLRKINIPASLKAIRRDAFAECESLAEVHVSDMAAWCNLEIEQLANPMRYGATFYVNGEILTDLSIPDEVTVIRERMFQGATALRSITISDTVTSIEDFAFSGCSGLVEVVIPDSVTSIGRGAFSGCSSLERITLPLVGARITEDSETYEYPFGYIFGRDAYENSVAIEQHNIHTTRVSSSHTTIVDEPETYYIPASLTSVTVTKLAIREGAFRNCSTLKSIELPKGTVDIPEYAFVGCTALEEFTLGENVTRILDYAFLGCTSLERVNMNEKVRGVWKGTFKDCTSLVSIALPSSATGVSESAFQGCTSLSEVTLSEQTSHISKYAFRDCTSLTSIKIPAGVTTIVDGAFLGCENLELVEITDLAAWCKIDFWDYTANPLYYAGNLSVSGQEVTELTIPAGVSEIGKYAFYGYKGLTSLVIPVSVTSIENYAFNNCTNLQTIYFGGSQSEWDAVKKEEGGWNGNTGDYTLVCAVTEE